MSNNLCIFKEGSVVIPEGFIDRTLNIIADSQSSQPPVNISRGTLPTGVALNDYISRQPGELQRNVQGWQEKERTTVVPGDNVCSGIGLDYSFLRPDNVRIWQKQAVFGCGSAVILVVSTSKPAEFTAQEEVRFQQVVQSFKPHA